MKRRAARHVIAVVLLGFAVSALADSTADLSQSKQALKAIQQRVTPLVNRLPYQRRYEIWTTYYDLLEHAWRMQVHYEMMTRHGRDRRAEFESAGAGFGQSLETLNDLLPADE